MAGFIDVIDVELSKTGHAFTVNAGVFDPSLYEECWMEEAPAFVHDPQCIVRTRIGYLMGDTEVWWPSGGGGLSSEVTTAVAEFALPFLERMHSQGALETFLSDSLIGRYPPPTIYLALLKHRRGCTAQACDLLDDLYDKSEGGWRARILAVRDKLQCP